MLCSVVFQESHQLQRDNCMACWWRTDVRKFPFISVFEQSNSAEFVSGCAIGRLGASRAVSDGVVLST